MAVKSRLPEQVKAGYLWPYKNWADRVALWNFVKDIPLNKRHRSYATLREVETGLSKSKSEARRTISQGGAYINNRRQQEIDRILSDSDLASETTIVLRSGKKKYALLRFTS